MPPAETKKLARPYRAFLTAALHRRFVEAASTTLLCCWLVQAVLNGVFSLWSWIPFPPAIIRTLALFLSMLLIQFIRISDLRVSRYTFDSPIHSLWSALWRFKTYETLILYLGSALLYAEIFIFMQPIKNNFSTIDPGRAHERPRVNERPIFLRCLFQILAVVQACWHLYHDYSRIGVPVAKNTAYKPGDAPPSIFTEVVSSQEGRGLRKTIEKCFFLPLFMVPMGVFVYWVFGIRLLAWRVHLLIASMYTPVARSSKLHTMPPFLGDVMFHFVIGAFCLVFLWEITNQCFTLAVSRAPIKKSGETLSQQPDQAKANATLISGLRSKRDLVKTNAFWELVLIAFHFPKRRIAIFQDISQPDNSTWSQIFTTSLAELHAVVKRIQDVSAPAAPAPPAAPSPNEGLVVPRNLPGLRTDATIFQNPAPPKQPYARAGHDLGQFAKSFGSSPGAVDPFSPRAKRLLEKYLPPGQKEVFTTSGVYDLLQFLLVHVTRLPYVGWIFQCTFSRRATSIILGAPLANASIVVDAVEAITQLAICAKTEDRYGLVFRDVATMIRTYSSTLEKVQAFLEGLQPHWSEVGSRGTGLAALEDGGVRSVHGALRNGLQKLVGEFAEHADELELSRREMRRARELCGLEGKERMG